MQTFKCNAPATGDYNAYRSVTLGEVTFPSRGRFQMAVRPIDHKWQPMNLKTIRLQSSEVRD
jgi:hypothetical protein